MRGFANLKILIVSYVSATRAGFVPTQWSTARLSEALLEITNVAGASTKYCFLVDGLDEFFGDVFEGDKLIELIKSLSQKTNVKMCVSSRPEAQWLRAFNRSPKIRLQDLTYSDMEKVARGELQKDSRMLVFFESQPGKCDYMSRLLCRKADGVFLWLRLALRSVKEGLLKLEGLDELRCRIENMHGTLEDLFTQLLASIDHVHRPEIALLLKVVGVKRGQYSSSVRLLNCAFSVDACLRKSLWSLVGTGDQARDRNEVLSNCIEQMEEFKLRVLTRSAGLLDINKPNNKSLPFNQQCSICSEGNNHSSLGKFVRDYHGQLEGRVPYVTMIHRSVVEFLSSDTNAASLLESCVLSDTEIAARMFDTQAKLALLFCQASIDSYLGIPLPSNESHYHPLGELQLFGQYMTHVFDNPLSFRHDEVKSYMLALQPREVFVKLPQMLTDLCVAMGGQDHAFEVCCGLIDPFRFVPSCPGISIWDTIIWQSVRWHNHEEVCEYLRNYHEADRQKMLMYTASYVLKLFEKQLNTITILGRLLSLGLDPNLALGELPDPYLYFVMVSSVSKITVWQCVLDRCIYWTLKTSLKETGRQAVEATLIKFVRYGADVDSGIKCNVAFYLKNSYKSMMVVCLSTPLFMIKKVFPSRFGGRLTKLISEIEAKTTDSTCQILGVSAGPYTGEIWFEKGSHLQDKSKILQACEILQWNPSSLSEITEESIAAEDVLISEAEKIDRRV